MENRIARFLGENNSEYNNLSIDGEGRGGVLNLDTILSRTKEIHDQNQDVFTSLEQVDVVKERENIMFYAKDLDLLLPFTEWSLSQFCLLAGGVNVGYIKKCLVHNKVDLALTNLREWLNDTKSMMGEKERPVFLRHGERLNGILSNRYSVLDDYQVVSMLDDVFRYQPIPYAVQGYYLTSDIFNLRVIQKEPLNVPNEDLFIGFNIWNSRVGRSSLNVTFLIWKQVCSNGLILPKQREVFYSQRHMGIDEDKFVYDFKRMVQSLPSQTRAIEEKVTEAIDSPFPKEELNRVLLKLKAETKIADKAIEEIVDRQAHYGNHRWGFINGLTEVAQKYQMDQREILEGFAGKIL